MYWKDVNRELGDYSNDKKVGTHVILHPNGKTTIKEY